MIDPEQIHAMVNVAKQAADNAYCVYSNFPVGAALLMQDGEIVSGCNVENACYPLGNCAERTAIFSAIAKGYKKTDMAALLMYTPTTKLYSPCGACRQTIAEFFSHDMPVFSYCDTEAFKQWLVSDLLPDSFSLDEYR